MSCLGGGSTEALPGLPLPFPSDADSMVYYIPGMSRKAGQRQPLGTQAKVMGVLREFWLPVIECQLKVGNIHADI